MALAGIFRRFQTKGLAQVAIQRYGVSPLARRWTAQARALRFLCTSASSEELVGDVIGIDLGTTNSSVAIMKGEKPKILKNSEGSRTIPSVVAFNQKGELLVGTPAKREAVTNPTNTLFGTKRLMGRKFDDPETQEEMKMVPYKIVRAPNGDAWVEANGQQYSPSQIAAFVLRKMKETAESYLRTRVQNAVIIVPTYFNDAQRQATRDAGRMAGLEVRRIINEPTAAALSHEIDIMDIMDGYGLVAVFHLGGGTFDISIIEIEHDIMYQIEATNGDTFLGGDDFDNALLQYLVDEVKKTEGIDLSKDRFVIQRLREAAEKAKIELSSNTSTEIILPSVTAEGSCAKHLKIPLTRSKFEMLVNPLIERIRRLCEDCMKTANLTPVDIHEVLLVGGMTKVPRVRQLVRELFDKEPSKGFNPDKAVANGAARMAGYTKGDIENLYLSERTAFSLGIETLGGAASKLIVKNAQIPEQKIQVFSTKADDQRQIIIKLLQGEGEMAADNKVLGEWEIVDIPRALRGVPQIEVSFFIDADCGLHLDARDTVTGQEKAIIIHRSGGLSEAEIQKMSLEVEMYFQQHQKRKKLIEGKNQADNTMYSERKGLNESKDKLSAEMESEIESDNTVYSEETSLNEHKDKLHAEILSDMKSAAAHLKAAIEAATKASKK